MFSNKFSDLKIAKKIYAVLVTILFSLIGLTTAKAHEYKAGSLEIIHPWSRATVPQAKVGGGYLKIINHGDTADKLVKITSPLSDDTQIHEMAVVDGVMKMRQLSDGIEIPANGDVEFKPGSYHVMFMDLKNGLKKGEKFKAKLFFEKAGEVDVNFIVEAANKKSTADGSHAHHSDKTAPSQEHQH